jgi:uncharacterized membrane protein
MPQAPASPWLLLIHQLPPKPAYLRVKIWRRLQAIGAVPIKNSVYALPNTDEAREDFEWVLREIRDQHGDASLCEARLVDGLTDDEVRALFASAREADYRTLSAEIRAFAQQTVPARARNLSDEVRAQIETAVARFRKRLADIARIDFFAAPGREAAVGLVAGLEHRIAPSAASSAPSRRHALADVQRRTWVTRKGIHIDRIACAWLIRRFIDPEASFKFVQARGYAPAARELRFDMFDAEFTHDGDLCSFEVMLRDFGLDDPALRAVGEVVHDVDLKERKFSREETAGIEHLVSGLAWMHADDETRLAHGSALFDTLHGYFARRKGGRRNS